jgi:TolB protein
LTEGQAHWFGATYGGIERRGGGSNLLAWTSAGDLLITRRSPGAKVPWEYQSQRPDTDHFNREWKPETSVGGTQLCKLTVRNGALEELTPLKTGNWELRPCESPQRREIAFCRCATGESPSLWIMAGNGTGARLLTRGIEAQGADHPRWMPLG